MSTLEETLEFIVRKVVREELQSASEKRLMTAQQVAEYLSYDVNTVYQLKREGKLQGVKIGDNSLRFYQSEVTRFIQERAQ